MCTYTGRSFSRFQIKNSEVDRLSVIVPSTINVRYSNPSQACGLHVVVKDVFHLRGIKTSVCSRAFLKFHSEARETAACITSLQAYGAHILGATKLTSFAAMVDPIGCVDFEAPWNPRGDGYQSPGGSSSGCGVAVASYHWIDGAISLDSMFPKT